MHSNGTVAKHKIQIWVGTASFNMQVFDVAKIDFWKPNKSFVRRYIPKLH